MPVIGAGLAYATKVLAVKQPVFTEYVIVVFPALIAVATPDTASIVALAGVELLHVPPGTAFERVALDPTQAPTDPVIDGITGVTVACVVARQLLRSV